MAARSIVEYFAEHEKYRCGYCGAKDTNFSHGMWAHSLSVSDYQDLIDRGWRRSGKYVYKPTMDQTCCPQYTIRCEVTKYKPTKSQKKVLKRVHRYLNTGVRSSDGHADETESKGGPMATDIDLSTKGSKIQGDITKDIKEASSSTSPAVTGTTDVKHQKKANTDNVDRSKDSMDASIQGEKLHSPKRVPKPGQGADPSKPRCRKAKEIRMEKKKLKAAQMQINNSACDQSQKKEASKEKSLEDILGEVAANPAHRLEVKLVRSSPRSQEFKNTFDASCKLFKKYQMGIHKEDASECDQHQFTNFLVDSPLEEEHTPEGLEEGLGSFHQQYWLDGHLVAVGVIDILPKCTSSVYLYYDPDFSFLSLGTYSALRELAFTRQVHRKQSSIEYYYMGFYIHSCPKMVYKGKYYPSYLLCPETYGWCCIEDCRPKLDAAKYSRFAPSDKEDENKITNLAEVLILHDHQMMPYAIYRMLNQDKEDEEEVQQYTGYVGRTCAQRMLLYRS